MKQDIKYMSSFSIVLICESLLGCGWFPDPLPFVKLLVSKIHCEVWKSNTAIPYFSLLHFSVEYIFV